MKGTVFVPPECFILVTTRKNQEVKICEAILCVCVCVCVCVTRRDVSICQERLFAPVKGTEKYVKGAMDLHCVY